MSKYHKNFVTLSDDTSRSLIKDLKRIFNSRSDPRTAYQLQHMLSKFADPQADLVRERREAAIRKWKAVEDRNSRTNLRLFTHHNGDSLLCGVELDSHIERAASLIRRVIGSEPPTQLFVGSFSGGASTSKSRRPGMIERKFIGKQDVSSKAWDHVWPHIYREQLWCELNPLALQPEFRDHSILFTVPKNDTVDRVACKEPDYNMYMQKGVGDFIRTRLRKRCKINLNDQTVNQDLASRAQAERLATVDLSSASDSVTTQLLVRLLPVGWFVYLDQIRVSEVLIDNDLHSMEMFSTMGNGFTFELESLVFWALTRSLVDHLGGGIVSVYGDDIIAPAPMFGALKTLFNYCGFTVNVEKSFFKGPIRESCGRHFYNGVDVTPFYIKRPVGTLSDLIRVLNRLRKWASKNGASSWCDPMVAPIWRKYAKLVPREFHGGHDLDSIETLVSNKGPGYRLMQKVLPFKGDLEFGRYLHWHADARLRTSLTDSTMSIQVETSHYVIKKRVLCPLTFGLGKPLFDFEVE